VSSGGFEVGVPGLLFVPRLLLLEAVPQLAEEAVGEVTQGGVVAVSCGALSVVVGSGVG
jgi:hypothetical protein